MSSTLIATTAGITLMAPDGSTVDLTLPTGVSMTTNLLRAAVLDRIVLLTGATSLPIFGDINNNLYPARLPIPTKPVLATSGTGYTGTVRAKVQFLIKDAIGNILAHSEMSEASDALACSNQGIQYTLPTSPDPAVNARRVYRTATLGTNYFADFDVDDNTTTSITNSHSDASLAVEATDSGDFVTGPSDLDLVVAHGGRAWGRTKNEPDTLYGSAIDDVSSWPIIIPTYPHGADFSGITGLGKRRDDLVVLKRKTIQKLVGDSEDSFRMVQVAQGRGCVAPGSVVVIDDVVYWLDSDGVWTLKGDTIECISDETVRPWFSSTTYFERTLFANAFAGYDPRKRSYDLFLSAAGSTVIDRYVSYDILTGRWFGPHKIAAFTPVSTCVSLDSGGNPIMLLTSSGSGVGNVYRAVPDNYSDGTTGATSAIVFDVMGKFHQGNKPDYTHAWLQPTIFTKKDSAGTLTVTPYVGQLDASAGTAQSHALTAERERIARLGVGRLCQLEFTQSTDGQGVELYGYHIPYITLGRR